MCLNRR
ncbi:hypothetical protein D039_5193A, partial [Vibrio parahaemolyticus EKP-028]